MTGILTICAGGNEDPLPPLNSEISARWLESYHQLVEKLCVHFGGGSDWWFVPLSSRDQFASPLQHEFQKAARVEAALNDDTRDRITVVAQDGVFASSLARLAGDNGWTVRRTLNDRMVWSIRSICRRALNFFAFVSGILWLFRNWLAGIRNGAWRKATADLDTVLVAPLHAPIQSGDDGIVIDTYFGGLPRRLMDKDQTVAITGPLTCSARQHARAIKEISGPPIIPLAHMTGFGDVMTLVVQSVWRWLYPPRPPVEISNQMPLVSALVRREIANALHARLTGAHLERAFRAVLRRSPNARVIHTYENNPWERAIDRAARSDPRPRPTVGYLHCAILESHLKNHVRAREDVYRPAPDHIVCTGKNAREMLLSLGEHDPGRVSAGCALRFPDRGSMPLNTGPRKRINRLLILLEALPTMPRFLRFVSEALPFIAERQIFVRAHPVLSAQKVAAQAGVKLAPDGRIEVARGGSLLDDLNQADAVIFKGTTAALEAGYRGIPLIRYQGDWWTSDDPLRGCDALKYTVTSSDQLADAINHFETITTRCLNDERKALREYLDGYFTAPDEKSLAPFLD